jgi:ferredoxin
MKSVICHFSGSGNSRTLAEDLARSLSIDAVHPIRTIVADPSLLEGTTVLGLVLPVYFFGPPQAVRSFILTTMREAKLELEYLYIVFTHGGMPCYAPSIVDRLLAQAGYAASRVDAIKMVDTYIPLYRIPAGKALASRHAKIEMQLRQMIEALRHQDMKVATRLPLTRLFQAFWEHSLRIRGEKDRRFIVTDACTGCGICAKRCPVGNIVIDGKRPRYHHACEQCLACYHHCPEHAIRLKPGPLRGYSWYVPPKSFLAKE